MISSVFIALAAAACWGTADFLAGVKSRSLAVPTVLLASQTFGLAIAGALVLAGGAPEPDAHEALASLAAGAAGIAGLSLFYRALAQGTMSVVAPIGATGVAFPVLVGVVGGDRLHGAQAFGIAAAVVGVVLAARHSDPGQRASAGHGRAVALALLAALGFGGYFIGSHTGVRGGVAWLLLLTHAVAVLGVLVACIVMRAPLVAPRGEWRGLITIATLDMSAAVLYAVANRHGLLSIVAVVGSVYPVVTVALAGLALRERVGRPQAVGIGLALVGVGLIAG